MHKFRKLNKKGFTLIELMIVVVIIGILAALAIPRFSEASRQARASEADSVLKQVCTLQQAHIERFNLASADLTGANTVDGALARVGWDPTSNAPNATTTTAGGKYYWGYQVTAGGPPNNNIAAVVVRANSRDATRQPDKQIACSDNTITNVAAAP